MYSSHKYIVEVIIPKLNFELTTALCIDVILVKHT